MRIEILCTGDEVLSGKTVNTNYSHMARRLQETGLDVYWGTTVGDDRASLIEAFRLASARADAVIVNGGLGPTVDDLSQEVAAEAAGVGLELNAGWLTHIEAFYTQRGRVMPPNNRKQAMLPAGSELIDNPIGSACGFALDIGAARFFFTPGVPREIHRMLDEQVIPRLLSMRGTQVAVALKRFHSFGLGESRVDDMLRGVEELAVEGEVKLGFQAHYPQLETKLFAQGSNQDELDRRLEPMIAAVRERLGSYLLAEGANTLEGAILAALTQRGATVAVCECATHGAVGGRLAAADETAEVFLRGALGGNATVLARALSLPAGDYELGPASAELFARAVCATSASDYGLAVLVEPRTGAAPAAGGRPEGMVHVAVSRGDTETASRSACLVGGPERVRAGGVELGLDALRRWLQDLPIDDLIDFEKQGVASAPPTANPA